MSLVGRELWYREDGGKLRVLVIADNSNHDFEEYELRVLHEERQGGVPSLGLVIKPADEGEEFSVSRRHNSGAYGGMWTMTDDHNRIVAPQEYASPHNSPGVSDV